ncbi:MAG: ERCC4 domain-containing protein [Ruminococcus sp.]|nr:MAG: ERCC4 domain-containing protein [Ruminococcus sp.]
MIICDSREKKNAHILQYFDRNGIAYKVRKMDVADYQTEGRDTLVIDRKQNLDELATNLTNPQDKGRFWREVRRAYSSGIKMIVLCEHGKGIKSIPLMCSNGTADIPLLRGMSCRKKFISATFHMAWNFFSAINPKRRQE